MRFLLDTNVFVEGRKRHYGMDFCPAFWSFLLWQNSKGTLRSIDKVKAEILEGNDELKEWAKQRGPQFFVPMPGELVGQMKRLTAWVVQQGPRYSEAARSKFFSSADYFLVALAAHTGETIVTHEVSDQRPTRVKIPDACNGMGVTWVPPWEMLRGLGAKFVLPGS